jgi:hypothetical protein
LPVSDPLEKPDGLNWDPAAVELPDVPMLPPGEDAMSATIAAVLPTLTVPLAANVAALSAKENMFTGKLGAAESAYQNADASGQQSIGQFASMLGQLGQQAGQLSQSAGAPAQAMSGQMGMFGSLMQQAMQGAQGGAGGSSGGQSSGGQAAGGAGVAGQGPATAGGAPQPARDDAVGAHEQQPQEPRHDEREALQRAEADDRAGPSEAGDGRPGAGPAPVTPPERGRDGGEDDLSRWM